MSSSAGSPEPVTSPPDPVAGSEHPAPDHTDHVGDVPDVVVERVEEPHPVEINSPEPIELSAGPFQLVETTDEERDHAANSKRKVRTVLLSSLLVVTLAGAATLGYVGYQVNTQRHTTLSIPASIGGFQMDDSEEASSTADYLQSAISAEITMDKAVGAVYTGDDDRSILFFGGTRLLWAPDKELDNAFTLLGDEEGTVTDVHEVDAGDLGGTMKCGTTSSDGTDLTVCGWADHGSLAVAMFLDRSQAEAATLMREIRSATQTRP